MFSGEENLGIIGANLALSPSVYAFFRDGSLTWTGKRRYQHHFSRTEKRSKPKSKERGGLFLSSKSQESIIPLEGFTMKKTMDLSIRHENRNASSDKLGGLGLENRIYTADDQV